MSENDTGITDSMFGKRETGGPFTCHCRVGIRQRNNGISVSPVRRGGSPREALTHFMRAFQTVERRLDPLAHLHWRLSLHRDARLYQLCDDSNTFTDRGQSRERAISASPVWSRR